MNAKPDLAIPASRRPGAWMTSDMQIRGLSR
jgi:hypothetical protein